MNLAHDLERGAARTPGKPAIVASRRTLTFAELDNLASKVAEVLAGKGVRRGDRVAVLMPSVPEHVATFYGILKLGAVHVGVNLQLRPPEVVHQLADADVALAVTGGVGTDLVQAVRGEVPKLGEVLTWDEAGGGASPIAPLLGRQPGLRCATYVGPDDAAVIFYTSGTTGVPKGVVHTHAALSVLLDATQRHHAVTETDTTICLLPLYMLSILLLGPAMAVRLGNTLHLLERYDPLAWARTVTTERVTYALGTIPTLYVDLAALGAEERAGIDLSSLRFATFGGSPMPLELRQRFERDYGFTLSFGFGGTEGPAGVATEPRDRARRAPGSVGFAYDHVDLRVVDHEDRPLPPGEIGEIATGPHRSGPYAGVYRPMKEYWNMPEATGEALRGGYLHWGDLGYLDEDGHLFVVDRKKDMIIRAGMNIYPAQIERVLLADPRVEQAAVLGVPAADARLGEVPFAFVKLAPGAQARASDVEAVVAENLAPYNRLCGVEFVDELPRNALGKVVKRELRERAARLVARAEGVR